MIKLCYIVNNFGNNLLRLSPNFNPGVTLLEYFRQPAAALRLISDEPDRPIFFAGTPAEKIFSTRVLLSAPGIL